MNAAIPSGYMKNPRQKSSMEIDDNIRHRTKDRLEKNFFCNESGPLYTPGETPLASPLAKQASPRQRRQSKEYGNKAIYLALLIASVKSL